VPDVSAEWPARAAPTATTPLAPYTTLRLGGPAGKMLIVTNADEIMQTVRATAATREAVLVLGGGSNVVVADEGFPGTVILIRSTGLQVVDTDDETVTVRVEAGMPWDEVVATAVAEGWSGLECLSGIPGGAGATPIQNVSAYGQEVAETLTAVRVLDRLTDEVRTMTPDECRFGYRTSVFRGSDRWVVLSTEFRLRRSGQSATVRYAELAQALGVAEGARAPLATVREAVLALRAGKGMVLDPADRDTWSAGSFFLNPLLDNPAWQALRQRCPATPPCWPAGDGQVKTSAAWLIERAGYGKGYPGHGVAISSKHSLSLTNRGAGTTAALLALAREIRAGVEQRFGVTLHPEPTLVGCEL
jgi:UDP-N-acetylmuramate dehydrogenase